MRHARVDLSYNLQLNSLWYIKMSRQNTLAGGDGKSVEQAKVDGSKAVIEFANSSALNQGSVNLQNLDNLKQKSATTPSGVLAICIQNVVISTLDTSKLYFGGYISIYVRVLFGEQVKYTHVARQPSEAPFCLVFEEMKHFSVDPGNELTKIVTVELVGVDPDKPFLHKILCKKEICLMAIIGCAVDQKTHLLSGDEEHIIAVLKLEYCYSYGTFGYGFSNQLLHRGKTPQDQVARSMFFRPEPPLSRVDILNDIIQCRHVGHTPLVNFRRRTDIGTTINEFNSEIEIYKTVTNGEPTFLMSEIDTSLKKKQTHYSQLNSVKERLDYLSRLVSNRDQHTSVDATHFVLKDGMKLKTKSSENMPKEGDIEIDEQDQMRKVKEALQQNKIAEEAEKMNTGFLSGMRRRLSSVGGNMLPNFRRRLSTLGGTNFMMNRVNPAASDISGSRSKETEIDIHLSSKSQCKTVTEAIIENE